MILTCEKENGTVYIDIDHITLLDTQAKALIMNGVTVSLIDDMIPDIERAFIAMHKSHMYDKELKKIRWIKGEK